jgi:hypothetical protein
MTDSTTATLTTAHKSLIATILGALMWILTGTGASIISHFLPAWLVAIMHPLGELLTAIGAAFQIHQNTTATVASTAAVVAAVTSAPVNMAPNPAIVAAQARGAATAAASRAPGNPMQGS